MKEHELKELRQRNQPKTFEKFIQPAERQAILDEEKAAFFAAGGQVNTIPFGKSGAFPDAGMSIKLDKDLQRAREYQNRINHSVAQSKKGGMGAPRGERVRADVLTDSRFIGAICPVDKTNIRYNSNAACVACTKRRDQEKAKAMQGNSRRADGRKER
jgi:hypothetical protein